jgi:hypothetical protein
MDDPAATRIRLDTMQIYEPILRPPSLGGCNFPRTRILAACETPDRTQRISWNGLIVDIHAKACGGRLDVVGVAVTKEPWRVMFALEAYPDLCDRPLGELTPVQIVERLADRFGLMVTIGNRSGRFFLEEEIPLPGDSRKQWYRPQLFELENVENHPFVLPAAATREDLVARVALGFCIDLARYGDWINGR